MNGMLKEEITLVAEVVSPLHIGSGAVRPATTEENPEGGEIALLQRAASHNTWLPGTTLKGALAAVADQVVESDAKTKLFGAAKDDSGGQQGRLTCFGAEANQGQVFVDHRTAIHRGTGASEKNKLFARELLDIGAKFTITLQVLSERQSEMPEHGNGNSRNLEALISVLEAIVGESELSLGSGKSSDFGRLRFEPEVDVTKHQLGAQGWETTSKQTLALKQVTKEAVTPIIMVCPGPYLSSGQTETELRPGSSDGETRTVKTPLRKNDNTLPRINGSGVKGALRSRAEWLVALDEHRGQKPSAADVTTSAGEKPLSAVQRLFGDEGYRGSLSVGVRNIKRQGVSRHPSVRLDPITQAPIKGPLFLVEADHGVRFDLVFDWFRNPQPDEEELFAKLKNDLEDNGLKLGFGTTKGFGWFNCEPRSLQHDHRPRIEAEQNDRPDHLASLREKEKDNLPDPATKLPYRLIEIDTGNVTLPETPVAQAWSGAKLHSKPLDQGVSGHIDVDWVFETPVLIGNGQEIRGPQCYGPPDNPQYYLPGSTLKGYVRSVMSIALNARLTHLNDLEYYEDERNKTNENKPERNHQTDYVLRQPLTDLIGRDAIPNAHRPAYDETFQPDFVQALLGFIEEADALDHEKKHLKSRLSFGFAKLTTPARLSEQRSTTLTQPKGTAVFYDHIGVKRYVPGFSTHQGLYDLLPPPDTGNEEMVSQLQFLEPMGATGQPLTFRGRIAFHNVTQTELGALIWVLLGGASPRARHLLGTGRPFGFGRCACVGFDTKIVTNGGEKPGEILQNVAQIFGAQGDNFAPAFSAFARFLDEHDRSAVKCDAVKALLNSFDPAYGQLLRNDGGLAPTDAGYQTKSTFVGERDDRGKTNFYQDMPKDSYRKIEQVRKESGGRLAALLRRKP